MTPQTIKRPPRATKPGRALFSPRDRGRLGGSRQTPAQVRARMAMQAARRGVRINSPLPRETRSRIKTALRTRDVSIKSISREAGISDRTLRRWLSGEDWPSNELLRQLESALATLRI